MAQELRPVVDESVDWELCLRTARLSANPRLREAFGMVCSRKAEDRR